MNIVQFAPKTQGIGSVVCMHACMELWFYLLIGSQGVLKSSIIMG